MIRLSRRALLAAAGASLAAGRRRALAAPPQRLVVVYSPNGFLADRWLPPAGATETNFQLGPTMQPLARHAADLVIVDGLENRAAIASAGAGAADPAARSMATLLTGRRAVTDGRTQAVSADGPSLDRVVGAQGGTVSGAPVVLGIGTEGVAPALATPSYYAARTPVPAAGNLGDALATLFPAGVTKTAANAAELRGLFRIATAASQRNLAFLRARVGGDDDRRRLDAHGQALRDLQAQIDAQPPLCQPPPSPAATGRDLARLPDLARTWADTVVAAFRCDRARAVTLVWEGADGNARIAPGATGGHRDLAVAAAAGDAAARAALIAVEAELMQALAYLVDGLAATRDGGGFLLDSTLILACSDVASAAARPASLRGLPCLLIGGAGGRLRTGRYLRAPGAPWNQLLTSLAQIMGVGGNFGDPAFGAGVLPGL